jgi:hypothetical protein
MKERVWVAGKTVAKSSVFETVGAYYRCRFLKTVFKIVFLSDL